MTASKKILIVDDSNTILMMQQMILKKEGYQLVTAKDGVDGVAKTRAERPDLVLMDVMMPNMNGFEALQAIRADPEVCLTPVIMVTTRAEAENVESGYLGGCSDYVTKPINGAELLAKVRNLIG
jgi:DNA-binding response OmpR family regulator